MKVYTKQNDQVLRMLTESGRYTAKREYIVLDLQEHAPLVLEVYDWLVQHSLNSAFRPVDAEYPVWVSFGSETTMLPSPGCVILELDIDPELVARVNIAKWGAMLNYSYLPISAQDAKRHAALLEAYRVSDAKAYMSQFYPQVKREIVESWNRLFDDAVQLGNQEAYGIIWEIRKEWVTRVL